jgi:hypothetical protein
VQHAANTAQRVECQKHNATAVACVSPVNPPKNIWLRDPDTFSASAWHSFKVLRLRTILIARPKAPKDCLRWLWDYPCLGAARTFYRL